MKILITGSSGYVGYILSKYLSEKKYEVIGLDIEPNHAWQGNKHFSYIRCDVRDKRRLQIIFQKHKPTHVIHLAFLMEPLHDRKKHFAIDVQGSKNVFDIANQTSSVQQFIQFSSTSAYGAWPEKKWLTETDDLRPRDYRYGQHKKIIEEYYLKEKTKMNLVILRMCTAVGPLYHKKGGVISLLHNAPFMLKLNNRYCELQFIHEDDLTVLIHLIMSDSDISGIFNLTPDSYATTKQLAKTNMFIPLSLPFMRFLIGILWELRLVTIRPAAMTLSTYGIVASPHKLMSRYNYTFKYSTLQAVRETFTERKRLGTL